MPPPTVFSPSRRVARIMALIALEIPLAEGFALVDRKELEGSFSELQEADQIAILEAERGSPKRFFV